MTKPRLVATDLDGTFLSPDGSISAENRRAVADAAAAGLPLVFVTGRPPRWLQVLADLPLAHPTVIASNGALLWDLGESRALWAEPIAADIARESIARIRRILPGATFGVEQGTRFGHEPAYRIGVQHEQLRRNPAFFCAPAEVLVEEPFVKLLVQHADMDSDTMANLALAELGNLLTVTHSSWGSTGLLELSAPGVTKAHTLERYAATLGVAAGDVAAFGDMPNDRSMLAWAGRAYVMAEGHPSLFDLPVTRIGSNADSAVGRKIREWL